jgi:hypothetical protein
LSIPVLVERFQRRGRIGNFLRGNDSVMVRIEDGEHRRKSGATPAFRPALASRSARTSAAAPARTALAGRRVLGLLSVVLGDQGHRW